MLPSFADDTVTLTDPVWADVRGKRVATYTNVGREVTGCCVQDAGSSSDRENRDNAEYFLTVLLPPGTPVTRHTKVTFEGEDFKIEGRPARWKSPTGAISHVEIRLVDWEG